MMDEYEGDLDGPRQKPPFWARHTKEMKIVLVVIVCGLIAGVVPFFVNKYGFHLSAESQSTEDGTCRLLTGFKKDCLPDFSAGSLVTTDAKDRCAERGCCWDNSTTQMVNCFHQLPSYQYSAKVENIAADTMSGELMLGSVLENTEPKKSEYKISSDGCGHVVFDIGTGGEALTPECSNESVSILVGCPGFSGVEANKCAHPDIFTLELTPTSTMSRSSFVRTHFGPIMMSEDLTEISFYLPGPRVFGYGMEEFIWSGEREVSHFNFGPSSSVHLPFLVGMHPNQDWFMLWLETSYPGEQIISSGTDLRPILTWRTMGGPIKVHLLTETSLVTLLKRAKEINNSVVPIPPYWTLGYQLCRSVGDQRAFRSDVAGMKLGEIPFDLDCIDERMIPTAFNLDETTFPTISNLFDLVSGKDILLPLVVQRTADSIADGCVGISSSNSTCFEGRLYGEPVIFPDPLDSAWMQTSYDSLINTLGGVTIAGWHLHDTGPTNDLMQGCPMPGPGFTPRNMSMTHNLCYNNWIKSTNSSYISQHSLYSLEVSKGLQDLTPSKYQFAATHQVGQAAVGGFLGSSAPATWAGMAASLREVLMLGLAGQSQVSMPACGTVSSKDQEDVGLLCLRWFQLGSFMSSMRSWYSDTDNVRMPYKLPKTYQHYITWALEKRYKMLPYLRTLQIDWTKTGLPLVRPMVLNFPSSEFIGLWEQFMVGSDLVVAPILAEDQQLVGIHLPQGAWYGFNSGMKYMSPSDRNILNVKPKLYQIPVLQRGGTAILLYDTTSGKQSAKEVTTDAQFELQIGLDCSSSPRDTKSLSACVAKSSLPWILSNEDTSSDYKAAIDVKTVESSGYIEIKVSGKPSQDEKVLSVVNIYGLSLKEAPVVTLPNEIKPAAECTAQEEGPCLSWQPEQEILMIKNAGIVLAEQCVVPGCKISWVAQQS